MLKLYQLPDLLSFLFILLLSSKKQKDYARELCFIPFFNLLSPFWILVYLFCPKFSNRRINPHTTVGRISTAGTRLLSFFFFFSLPSCIHFFAMQSAQTELDFINLYLESLSSKSVRYGEDYMSRTLPSPLRIKVRCFYCRCCLGWPFIKTMFILNRECLLHRLTLKKRVISYNYYACQCTVFIAILILAPVAPAPANTNTSSDKMQVTIKVLKPSSQFTIGGLSLNDTVHQLKQRIYQQQSSLAVNRQRLLIKGKVLADQKTLAELSVQPDAVIHLMVTAAPASSSAASTVSTSTSPASSPNAASTASTGRFGISAQAEQKLSSPEFWSALEKTLVDQVGEADAKLLLSQVQASFTA